MKQKIKSCKRNQQTIFLNKEKFIEAMTTTANEKHKEIQRNSGSARKITIWGETKSLI